MLLVMVMLMVMMMQLLSLRNCYTVQRASMRRIARLLRWHNVLEALDLGLERPIGLTLDADEHALASLAAGAEPESTELAVPALRSLSLAHRSALTDTVCARLLRRFGSVLATLDVRGCNRLTLATVRLAATINPHLELMHSMAVTPLH